MAWSELKLETLEDGSMNENDGPLDCRGSNLVTVMIVLSGLAGAVLWGLALLGLGVALLGACQ